jgi:hypothetical protein
MWSPTLQDFDKDLAKRLHASESQDHTILESVRNFGWGTFDNETKMPLNTICRNPRVQTLQMRAPRLLYNSTLIHLHDTDCLDTLIVSTTRIGPTSSGMKLSTLQIVITEDSGVAETGDRTVRSETQARDDGAL